MEYSKIKDEQLEGVTGGTWITYTVETGDTLRKLAEKFHCPVEDLCRWNGISNPDQVILPGQALKVLF